MITNVYQESCCDECREIIHNHFDCPICIIENSKRRGYQGTDQYTYISNDIAEIDGFEAVRLWHQYKKGNLQALQKLMRYNKEDIVNLKSLLNYYVTQKAGC